ncbi:fused MFS/spermidine synthase [Flavobacterium sp. CBA20B-1]|uniref:spermidine synthase n=1 Tax=unclassified Flavobacterium TaxID=196869 RepID=UPI002225132B|nr:MULTISPECIES: fused MFS/spermidine synthase [unclassified Flavobacterium]WCM42295.1 fused MFS/spermidine synthase [Flavobacterium sp. CBA20B-1]
MNFLKKYLSYLNVIPEKTYSSAYSGILEINWLNGKKVLDTQNTNYSYGNLGKVLKKALQATKTDFRSNEASILVLGLGGGDVVQQLRRNFQSKAVITAVEIDPMVIQVAMNEFGIIPNQSLEIVNNDAFQFIKYSSKRYHVVIVDLFNDTEIPEFVFQNSFVEQIYKVLYTNGTAIFNTFILNEVHNLRNEKLLALLKKHFEVQSFKNLYGHNHLMVTQKIK